MTTITIRHYTKSTRDIDVTFPVYIQDLRSYEDGTQYNEFILLHEDGRSISVTEGIAENGKVSYHIDSSDAEASRLIGYCYDDKRREEDGLKSGEGYAFITADEFGAKLGEALIAIHQLTAV